ARSCRDLARTRLARPHGSRRRGMAGRDRRVVPARGAGCACGQGGPHPVTAVRTNLRHLRLLLAVAETGSMSRAAARCHVTQPAVTQAITKLERLAGQALFIRRSAGMFATPAGEALVVRLRRAFDRLDTVMAELAPRLVMTATTAQLDALIASTEAES